MTDSALPAARTASMPVTARDVESLVSAVHVRKRFETPRGPVDAVDDVTLSFPAGSFTVIVGPSGCGKSTLLRMIAGLEAPTGGRIDFAGRTNGARPTNALVFQGRSLFPWLTLRQNVAYGLRLKGMSRRERGERADDLLELVGLRKFARSYPHQVSEGMRQRVAIARALAMRPKVMLFDEVTSALDPEVIGEVTNVIRKLVSEYNLTMLMVTHQMGFARDISDRICFFFGGRIEEQGTPDELFNNPRKERTQQFLRAVKEAV